MPEPLFSLVIDVPSSCFGETDTARRAKVAHLLSHAASEIMRGSSTGGDLLDGNSKAVGRFSFRPT